MDNVNNNNTGQQPQPQQQEVGENHRQAPISHDGVDSTDTAALNDDNEGALAATQEEEEEDSNEEEQRRVLLFSRIIKGIAEHLRSGSFSFSDGEWDEEGDTFYGYYPEWMPVATWILSNKLNEHRWESFSLSRSQDEDDETPPRRVLDEFFQALASCRHIRRLRLYGDLTSQTLQSLALQFYQKCLRSSGNKLDELSLTAKVIDKPENLLVACPLLLIAKKVCLQFYQTEEVSLPTAFRNIRRALQKPQEIPGGENNGGDALTIAFDFSSTKLRADDGEVVALAELANLSRDFPFIKYEIKFEWVGQSLPKFISGIAKLAKLTLELRSDIHFGPVFGGPAPVHPLFQYRTLSTEHCAKVSDAIREACVLEELTVGTLFGSDAHDFGEGYTDLVKAIVSGLDKNKSLRKLSIGGLRTDFHHDLWSALAKNKDAELKSLSIPWNESDAKALWEGLETNKSLLKVELRKDYRSTANMDYSWHGFLEPLLRRNKLLLEAERYCRDDRKPEEFVDQLCALSAEPISYFNSTEDNIAKRDEVSRRDAVRRLGHREDPLPLPANFSALFVTVRNYLPHFVNKSIFIRIPLKDATEEDLRTIDFDMYGGIAGESEETVRRCWNEMTRRIREMTRRHREMQWRHREMQRRIDELEQSST